MYIINNQIILVLEYTCGKKDKAWKERIGQN